MLNKTGCDVAAKAGKGGDQVFLKECCSNSDFLNTILLPFLPGEDQWVVAIRGIAYFLALCYFFIAVAIASDIFMSSIEYIVSKSKLMPFDVTAGTPGTDSGGKAISFKNTIKVEVRVWNPTVANLTLMALGSSAPEILLSVIETISRNFQSGEGDLGPGTIVGSAAFNLLFITGVCVLFVPKGETRRIELYSVFIITTVFSLFAYFWILIVLEYVSPGVVDLWEAIVTLLCFPVLVLIAFWADNQFCVHAKRYRRKSLVEKAEEIRESMANQDDPEALVPGFLKDDSLFGPDGQINSAELIKYYKEIRENAELTDEEAATLVAYRLVENKEHSRMWYRMGATRALMGSNRMQPSLNEKLKQVYKVVNEYRAKPMNRLSVVQITPEVLNKKAVFNFQAASMAVPENIGVFSVKILRTGRQDNDVNLRVLSIEGTAKEGEKYKKVDCDVVSKAFSAESSFEVTIIDDKQWDPDKSFFLRLGIIPDPSKDDSGAILGPTHTMQITVVDDDLPGVLSFAKRGILISETARTADVEVVRTDGCDGVVAVNWVSVPDVTGGVKHPNAMLGKLTFQHGESSKLIHIPLYEENNRKDAETFDIQLKEAEAGAKLGKIQKCSITISEDAAFQETVNKVVELASAEMDIMSANDTIKSQLQRAFKVGDEGEAGTLDYIMHFITFFWKVLFALIPPPRYLGGWLCFLVSLATIGCLTAVIGDLATIFGCICSIKATLTAITFVALGTSLPDTFASMAAARHDPSADNAIGNVTGSNSVNVFLGLGVAWTCAAIANKVRGKPYKVPAGSLSFSVIVYSGVALAAVLLLTLRRYLRIFGKAELGGPPIPRIMSALIFLALWFIYIALSGLETYGVISSFKN